MDRTDSRFAPSPETASDDVASPFNSLPGEAADRLAFEPAPLRYREDGLTPAKQRAYVEALADCGIAREAAARVGVSEQSINRVRRRADAQSFDRACEAAHMFGARRLRSVAYERAIEGTLKGHYYRGVLVSEERVFDNRLLVFLLGKVAHLLEPSQEARAACSNWEPWMEAVEQGLRAPDPVGAAEADEPGEDEVWQQDDGAWRTCFPPPDGFDGHEEGQWDGFSWYCRALTPREQRAIDADATADRAQARARRDRFFGFAGDGQPLPEEAEPYEPSGLLASQSPSDGEWDHPQGGGGVEGAGTADPAPEPAASEHLPLHNATPGPPPHAANGEADEPSSRPATSKPLRPGILLIEPPGEPT